MTGNNYECAVFKCHRSNYGEIVLKMPNTIFVCEKHFREFMEVYKLIYKDPAVT
jgi:hypothetical protein